MVIAVKLNPRVSSTDLQPQAIHDKAHPPLAEVQLTNIAGLTPLAAKPPAAGRQQEEAANNIKNLFFPNIKGDLKEVLSIDIEGLQKILGPVPKEARLRAEAGASIRQVIRKMDADKVVENFQKMGREESGKRIVAALKSLLSDKLHDMSVPPRYRFIQDTLFMELRAAAQGLNGRPPLQAKSV